MDTPPLVMYSSFRSRATVLPAPICLATKQATMLTSSMSVAATTRSAWSPPASFITLGLVPLPETVMTSNLRWILSILSWDCSTTTTSWPSCEINNAALYPTIPAPTTITFILDNLPASAEDEHQVRANHPCHHKGIRQSREKHEKSSYYTGCLLYTSPSPRDGL